MKRLTYLLLVLTIGISSCKKSKNISICRIATVTEDNDPNTTATFSFDENGRPTSVLAKDQGTKYQFAYNGTTGLVEFRDPTTNALTGSATLGFDGLRLTSYNEIYMGLGPTLTYHYTFEYNSDGYLFRNIQTLTGGVYNDYYSDSLIYNNGNVVKMYTVMRDGNIYRTVDFEYYTDTNDQWNYPFSFSEGEPFSILSNYYNLLPLLGRANANLVKKVTVTYGPANSDIFDYTYTKDANGNVTAYHAARNRNGTFTSHDFTITYTCN